MREDIVWLADDECFWLCEYEWDSLLICQYELGRFLAFFALST